MSKPEYMVEYVEATDGEVEENDISNDIQQA